MSTVKEFFRSFRRKSMSPTGTLDSSSNPMICDDQVCRPNINNTHETFRSLQQHPPSTPIVINSQPRALAAPRPHQLATPFKKKPPPPPAKLTLLEIFQSQGCSSCPPANDNVIELSENDPSILLLTYEVTYWDYIGWKDTFGDKAFDQRQRDYASVLGRDSVFTPQVIVNGRSDGVGSTKRDLNGIVSRGTTTSDEIITIESEGPHILVSGPGMRYTADVMVVRYVPHPEDVYIKRGENSGRTLPHKNVVIGVRKAGEWKGGNEVFDIGEEEGEGIKRAVVLQSGRGGRVIGAARV